jgi:hypothetical protein
MDRRIELIRYVLQQANKPHDDAYVKKMFPAFWMNPRQKSKGGFRLTDSGWDWLKEADIKYYQIDIPKEVEWNNQLIIWLDQMIDCPFYLTKKSIFVFGERMAVQLVLFSGNIQKYGLAKAKSVAKTQQQNSLTTD